MLFLGRKTRKKNKGRSKGNEISRFALGASLQLSAESSAMAFMALLKPRLSRTTTFRQSLNACALSEREFLWRGEKAI
jgi:hypothetical protein